MVEQTQGVIATLISFLKKRTAVLGAAMYFSCAVAQEEKPVTLFQHHFITEELPDAKGSRYGTPVLADFDKDGDLDYAFSIVRDQVFWFEYEDADTWHRHVAGPLPTGQLGGASMDVDQDGWTDMVVGGFWFRNPQNPRNNEFERYEYDSTIAHEIHDIVIQDIDGDGREDVVVLGDKDGCFWYRVPEDPQQTWIKDTLTLEVLDERADIHAGFFPNGVGDIDRDGDADIVMPGRWYQNQNNGEEWTRRFLPFGSSGYWGLSCRSWVIDMDEDGDNDIVMVSGDQVDSRGVWLENNGNELPGFTVHLLPLQAEGRRGSFHSLAVADFDMDGDADIFTMEQEDDQILPTGATMKGFVWVNMDGKGKTFEEMVVFDKNLGGHDALIGDVDQDGDIDICFKIWEKLSTNANQGRVHAGYLENLTIP